MAGGGIIVISLDNIIILDKVYRYCFLLLVAIYSQRYFLFSCGNDVPRIYYVKFIIIHQKYHMT